MLASRNAVARLTLVLDPQGPWMVREQGGAGGRAAGNKTLLLRDHTNQPLLPASSLKGVLRSTSERILRSCDTHPDPQKHPFACIPFVHPPPGGLKGVARRDIACSELLDWHKANPAAPASGASEAGVYGELCLACQLFGATVHAGLLQIEDRRPATFPAGERTHVAIDRLTGAVGQGPFTDELALADQDLTFELTIINFALWQFGLLALVCQELNRGYTAVGGGTRKGQGRVACQIAGLEIAYARPFYAGRQGVVTAQRDVERNEPPVLPEYAADEGGGWRQQDQVRFRLGPQEAEALFAACVSGPWLRRIGVDGGGPVDG